MNLIYLKKLSKAKEIYIPVLYSVPVNAVLIRKEFPHVTCCWTDKARAFSLLAAPKEQHQRNCSVLKEPVCSCCEHSWRPVCPFCQLSTFLSRGCLLWAVGPGLKPCCPGISGGRRVKGYSCVSCFLLQLLTRASIHQQALLHCPNLPSSPHLPMNK